MNRSLRARAGLVAVAVVLVAGGAAAPSSARQIPEAPQRAAADASKPSTQQIADLFNRWNAALATGDPEVVADRYARDAVLLPTLSNRVRTDRSGIVEYFQHFLEKKPRGEITQSVINILDRNDAIDTGTYRFTLTAADGTVSRVDARYTFVYERRHGTWLIVNHHSSLMPEG